MTPEENTEIALRRKQMFLQFKAELEANATLQQLLERAYPDCRQSFIEDFAKKKVRWAEMGDNAGQLLEQEELQWVEKANDCLDQILQKKLFDAQCLWRAEQVVFDQVAVTDDFRYLEANVRACPFIEPITEADLELYGHYLQSSNFELDQYPVVGWQDHHEIVGAYRSDEGHVPAWYEFHNGRTGLGVYMTLPDIRLPKERLYQNLWYDTVREAKGKEKRANDGAKAPVVSTLPDVPGALTPLVDCHRDDWMKWFVDTFEDEQTKKVFKSVKGIRNSQHYDRWLESNLMLLSRADRTVPMEGWYDWKEAIHRAADSYSRIRIAETLHEAFEQYRLHIDMGLGFELSSAPPYEQEAGYRKIILDGRELNGDPRDFDF